MTQNPNNIPTQYQTALNTALQTLKKQKDTLAVMLMGSLVRGDRIPGSDIDLLVITQSEAQNTLEHTTINNIIVETARLSLSNAHTRLNEHKLEPYRYLDGLPLHDPSNVLPALFKQASIKASCYQMSDKEKELTTVWLHKIKQKLLSALKANNMVLAGYLVTMTSAEVIHDLFAVNDKLPAPTGGSMYSRLHDFKLDDELDTMFAGSTKQRAKSMIKLIDHLLVEFAKI